MRIFFVLALIGCSSSDADNKADPCGAAALGLGSAKALTAWKAPATCTVKSIGSSTTVIRTESDAKEAFACKTGQLGLDWKTKSLVVSTSSWSPAQVGLSAFDDGHTITLVSRQRAPCKNDPQPMPTPAISSLFLGGTGARTFEQSSCTIVTKCP